MEKNSKGGFTLLELIIVLVIVSLITFLALPRLFNSLTHVELKSAARRTTALLHQARDLAYFQKKRIKVSFNPETDQVIVFQYKDKQYELINSIQYSYPDGVKIKKYQKKDNIVNQDQFDIIFSPNGNSTGGIITLGNNRKRLYKIEVDFITGNARILE